MVLVEGIVKTVHEYCYWYWVLLWTHQKIGIDIGYCLGLFGNIGYWYWGKKGVLLMSAIDPFILAWTDDTDISKILRFARLMFNCPT